VRALVSIVFPRPPQMRHDSFFLVSKTFVAGLLIVRIYKPVVSNPRQLLPLT